MKTLSLDRGLISVHLFFEVHNQETLLNEVNIINSNDFLLDEII